MSERPRAPEPCGDAGSRRSPDRTSRFIPGQPGASALALALAALLPLCAPRPAAAELEVGDDAPPPTRVEESSEEPVGEPVSERITVTDTRLEDAPRAAREVPAHVTVIPRERIESGGAATLQDLLATEAGVVLFDQVGNDVSKTLDLRGFKGRGTRVYLDGAPLNEPRNNALALELVPLAALERVEITRGSTAALAGGGSEAGVINLWTRRGELGGGRLSLAAGDFGTREAAGSGSARGARFDLFAAASTRETDGFRDNSGGDLRRLTVAAGWELAGGGRLDLSLAESSAALGNPGALTPAEVAADRERAPFNALDFSDDGLRRAALNYRTTLARGVSLSANAFVSERDSDLLSTGRAAPLFGGFFLDSESGVAGATLQAGFGGGREATSRWTAGVEWLEGDTDARGISTPAADPGRIDPGGLGSDNTAERSTLGLYLQNSWQAAPAWSVSAGLRYDRDEIGYRERFPTPSAATAREVSELSARAGVTWAPAARWALYLSYGEGFLPPTAEELFSFPLFGSNPGLEPEDSSSWEVGARRSTSGGIELVAALFRVETENEIVFDPSSPLGLFGANVNAGAARRDGLELALRGRLAERLDGFVNLTLVDSELTSGENRGAGLPLVPDERLAAGLAAELAAGLTLRLDGLHVGEQVLDNDEANAQPPLAAYTVVNLRLSWLPGARRQGDTKGWTLFVDARNALDEEYATRGIFAFDFSTFSNEVFLTPAPGRRLSAGVEWRF